mgnify:CR=1 FL=1
MDNNTNNSKPDVNKAQPDFNDFLRALEESGVEITEERRREVENGIKAILSYEPRVGVFGKTGAGKSTLCNALFGKNSFSISDVDACTRRPQEEILSVGERGIKLIDVPGVGESGELDVEYAKLYYALLPEIDVVLWLLKADDRAFSVDEKIFNNFVRPHVDQGKPVILVLSQSDKMHPAREWNETSHRPGPAQIENIEKKSEAISKFFKVEAGDVIPISAMEKYNLTGLVDSITSRMPKDKRITFVREVSPENISEETKETSSSDFVESVFKSVLRNSGSNYSMGSSFHSPFPDEDPAIIAKLIKKTLKFVIKWPLWPWNW